MRARRIAVGVLLVLGTLFWTGFGLGLWAHRQALDTDEWIDTSAELLENEEIRTALGVALVDSLYDSASVREGLEQRLPPELDRLAAPASAALKEVARRNAPRVLGTEPALNAWRRANEAAHATLLAIVERDETDRSLTLDLESLLREMAEGTGLPPDAVDRLPPEVRTIEIARPDHWKLPSRDSTCSRRWSGCCSASRSSHSRRRSSWPPTGAARSSRWAVA